MMMNILPILLVLVLTSPLSIIITCTSPHQDDVIVKDGRRVVVVEYDKEAAGSTKVSISPPEHAGGMFSGPRELVCDAYGKCKDKLANAVGKTKEVVTKAARGVADEAKGVKEHTKEVVNDAIEKNPREAKNKASEKAKKGIVGKLKKMFGDTVAVLKDGASKDFDVIDSPKRSAEDISRNVTGLVKRNVENIKEQTKETIKKVQEASQLSVNDVFRKFKEVVLFGDKVGSLAGLIHMLGFSTAYGMCVWVTFVSSYVLGRYLPRQMFGVVQSRIYPVYFRAMAYCVSAALLGHLVGQKSGFLTSKIGLFQSLSLVSALLMVLINMIWVEPKVTKAMYRRMKLEKEEGRGVGVGVANAVAAKDGMADGVGAATVRSAVNGKGTRVAVDGGGDTVVRSVANGRGVRVAVKEANGNGRGAGVAVPAKDGMTDGGNAKVAAGRSVGADRQDVLRLNERLKSGGVDTYHVLRLNEKLKKLNAYSSALNLFTLVALTWHMAYMGQRLQGYTQK